MTILKFSTLLMRKEWCVVSDGVPYNSESVGKIILRFMHQVQKENITFNKKKFILAVANSNIDYLIYLLVGSLLNLKIILASPKQASLLLDEYPDIQIGYVFSSNKLSFGKLKVLKINNNKTADDFFDIKKLFKVITLSHIKHAQIVFLSSGTTRLAKLVSYSESKLFSNAVAVLNKLELNIKVTCLLPYLINHIYAFSIFFSTLLAGGKVVLAPRVNPVQLVSLLNKHAITHLSLIPDTARIVYKVLMKSCLTFPNLTVLSSSDHLDKDDIKNILSFASKIWNLYGQTEGGPRLTAMCFSRTESENLKTCPHNNTVSIGAPIHSLINIFVLNEGSSICRENEVGEICYQSCFQMEGYIDGYGKLKKVDSFVRTGDLGFYDEKGLFYLLGRKDCVGKINGHFVSYNLLKKSFDACEEVEKSFFLVNKDESQVIGFFCISDNYKYKRNIEEILMRHYIKKFPSYPRLQNIIILNELPVTENGKVIISKLKEEAALQ